MGQDSARPPTNVDCFARGKSKTGLIGAGIQFVVSNRSASLPITLVVDVGAINEARGKSVDRLKVA